MVYVVNIFCFYFFEVVINGPNNIYSHMIIIGDAFFIRI